MAKATAKSSEAKRGAGRKKGVRPQLTPQVTREICLRIARGESLNVICKSQGLPSRETIYAWLFAATEKGANKDLVNFSDNYARARQLQADAMIDDCLEIADDSSQDTITIEKADGSTYEKVNQEYVARSRLRVDARIRLAEKMAPRKYGRQALDVDVTSGGGSLEALMVAGIKRVMDEIKK